MRFESRRLARSVAAIGSGALVAAALAGPALASSTHYRFQTLNDNADTTFNQLLGINRSGVIAGYFGSGAQGHPNQGYLLFPQYYENYYATNNYPGSVQTQVTGLNDGGVLVGFWSDMNTSNQVNDNFGFYKLHGHFFNVNYPASNNASPPVNQLLGVNDANKAVGFYMDSASNSHGYTYSIASHQFHLLHLPGDVTSNTAAAINNHGDISGFATINGKTVAFLLHANGTFTAISHRGAAMTQAFGVNDNDEVVGTYTVGSGTNAKTYGFAWTKAHGFATVNDPHGVGTTTINGVNDLGELVGFYTDGAGNTDGLLATPSH